MPRNGKSDNFRQSKSVGQSRKRSSDPLFRGELDQSPGTARRPLKDELNLPGTNADAFNTTFDTEEGLHLGNLASPYLERIPSFLAIQEALLWNTHDRDASGQTD